MTPPIQESTSWDNPWSTKSVYKLALLEMFFSNKLTVNLYTVLLVNKYKNMCWNIPLKKLERAIKCKKILGDIYHNGVFSFRPFEILLFCYMLENIKFKCHLTKDLFCKMTSRSDLFKAMLLNKSVSLEMLAIHSGMF